MLNILSNGRSFTLHTFNNAANLNLEFLQFYRNVRFKHFFANNPNSSDTGTSQYVEKTKSYSNAPTSSNTLFEFYIEDLENNGPSLNKDSLDINYANISLIRQLRSYDNIKFCYADKGGSLVILYKSEYENLVASHLHDTNTYLSLNHSTDYCVHKRIVELINNNKAVFSSSEISYFINHEYSSSYFYVIPKIHKSLTVKEFCKNAMDSYIKLGKMPSDVTSRPIVSNINSPTCRLSHFIDQLLKPLLPLTVGYIKDSFDFLNKLPRNPARKFIFLSFDVVNLYTVIPHSLGLEAIHYWFVKFESHLRSFPIQLLLEMISIVLENNTFVYKSKYYKQLTGTAMGTKMAPTYAHLTLSYLEVKIFKKCVETFGVLETKNIQNNYFRFLDDIFIIWNPLYSIKSFVDIFNNIHPNFKFTFITNEICMPFLDILLINQNGTIETDIYCKPTDSKKYLHFKSHHPGHIKRNVPYCLSQRIARIVSNYEVRKQRFLELEACLQKLGYPKSLITDAIVKASSKTNLRPQSTITAVPVVFSYSQNSSDYFSSNVLPRLNNVRKFIASPNDVRFLKAMRQPTKLINLLNSSMFHKTYKCQEPRCKTCPLFVEKNRHVSFGQKIVYFNKNMSCKSKNIIYVLTCSGCKKLYVGETKIELRRRITLHRQHINHPQYSMLPVSQHIRNCSPNNFSVIPIFQLPKCSDDIRRKQESYFITQLKPQLNKQ